MHVESFDIFGSDLTIEDCLTIYTVLYNHSQSLPSVLRDSSRNSTI